MGGWLGGCGFRVEAPMGLGLSLEVVRSGCVSGVLPIELRTGSLNIPAKMSLLGFASRREGGALDESGSVG